MGFNEIGLRKNYCARTTIRHVAGAKMHWFWHGIWATGSVSCGVSRARSPTATIYSRTGFRPRTTGSFLCMPKERNRKKGHPGLCAPHREFRCGIPSLEAGLSGSGQGPFPGPGPDARDPSRAPSGLGFGRAPRSA
jgi:hypothetical protein